MITINDRLIGSIDAVNVANDKEVIRLDFKCKNQVTELLKLTDCDAVYINYQNGSVKDRYLVTDLTADGEWVTFSWLLGKNATRAHGKTFFIVCAQITENDEIVQEWNTELAFFDVRKGLETVTAPSEPLEDIFTQLVEMINAKLEPSNIKAGQNVTVAVSGNDVTISATGGTADAYTKAETDALLAEKQDKGDYATGTELGAEETARQNADASLQLQINAKAQQRRTLYTPTAVSVVAASIADGVYEATAAFTLIINPDASEPETVSVNAGDLFYVKVASVSPYCRGFVLGDDMTIFTYPDSDEGVTISRITDYNSTFLGIFADLNNKADASALAAKQDLLVSGTNIKTLNGQSVLGSGNLSISGGTTDYTELDNKPSINSIPLSGNKTGADLGLFDAPMFFTNVSATFTANSDTGYEDYFYKAVLTCTGVTASMLATVIFSEAQAASGNYALTCVTGTDSVTIYSNDNTAITIPTVIAGAPVEVEAEYNAQHAYSTDEQVVGNFIDGKPLYEITLAIDVYDLPYHRMANNTEYSLNISNVDTGFIQNQWWYTVADKVTVPLFGFSSLSNTDALLVGAVWDILNSKIVFKTAKSATITAAGLGQHYVYVVLRYTKTTD